MYSEYRRAWLLGIFMECPFGDALENCPAREFRKLSMEDRAQIVEGVDDEVVDRFVRQHQVCLASREGNSRVLQSSSLHFDRDSFSIDYRNP